MPRSTTSKKKARATKRPRAVVIKRPESLEATAKIFKISKERAKEIQGYVDELAE